jgi:hypothetical protein
MAPVTKMGSDVIHYAEIMEALDLNAYTSRKEINDALEPDVPSLTIRTYIFLSLCIYVFVCVYIVCI